MQDGFWDYFVDYPMLYIHGLFMLVLTVDIFVEFHVAYFYQGSYITNRFQVARNYFYSGLAFDLIPLLMLYITTFWPWLRHQAWFHFFIMFKLYSIIEIDRRIRDRLQLHRKYNILLIVDPRQLT
jgi:hypothetical protein